MARISTESLARSTSARPWRTIIAWIVFLVVFAGAAQAIFPLQTTSDVKLLNNPESEQGWQALIDHGVREEEHSGTETVILASTTLTVDDPTFQSAVQSTTDALRADSSVVSSATN